MSDNTKLGPWIRRFLLEHLVHERGLARNTQRSYRDTLALAVPFVGTQARTPVDRLAIVDVTAERVRRFLQDIEETRRCSTATRNQRLAALHALARFVGERSPEHLEWAGQIRNIPFKKCGKTPVIYLEKPEMDAVLASPDQETAQGRRDHAILLFLYNTGARADEAAQITVADLLLGHVPSSGYSAVTLRGKGNRMRHCPLWPQTATELTALIGGRVGTERVFLNRRGQPVTRFGIHTLVERHAAKARAHVPSLSAKRVSPHSIRHTTATHLLRAGVDINTIRAWLGHVSLTTTNIYAEVDLEMKAKALTLCEITGGGPSKRWREDKGLMAFLHTL
ncbi:MAG: tyrosine-type recombinase/integrase [Acidobacteriota bacterium]